MMVYGGGVDPLKLKFDCNRCKPSIRIPLLEVHPEHLPKRPLIHKPMQIDGKITWYTGRFRDDDRRIEGHAAVTVLLFQAKGLQGEERARSTSGSRKLIAWSWQGRA
ncbi:MULTISPECIES: hypothetical protein [unclassified Mesorhizobium]|uniref:hypothetical protein n=1 Tax=unclassified Mesorhizobium TaxID=325217 RepID=UPI001CCC5B8B|nr:MULTISPECIES: hypothetical protein [unclassified Mesorhizobium]MBZ9811089.1 hypothetical protein [Mesorhizobium sp. ESP-6-2]